MDALLVRLQRALAGRYAVEQELGRGGMAVVYLGHDLRLERRVAIKVFEREGGLISAGERFLREIRIAAQLQHPNILPVFESGEGEGLVYYVMPYVAGGSVRERLEREGPLPVADAVRIAREVAEALDHAHRAGIVHRDVKPDNIMLADGVAVVADFGIARAIEQSGGTVTDTGLAIGTPSYMSPEQAGAERTIDGRSDQYALGCVLYEMLAGTPPFTGPTSQAVMARHAVDSVPPLTTLRSLPVALERVILKALSKAPADRWATAKAFGDALEQAVTATQEPPAGLFGSGRKRALVLVLALTVVLAGGALLAWQKIRPSGTAAEAGLTLAVLPFEIQGDTADIYFADGMTDEVRGKLSTLPGFQVIARASASQYRGTTKPLRQVGEELGVRFLLTGTVRKVKLEGQERLVIRPELVEIEKSGRTFTKWQASFNGDLVDVFQVQSSIAGQVAEALRVVVSPAVAPLLATAPTTNLAAYDEFMRGERVYFGGSGFNNLNRALEYYERAVALDSTFARAWGRISQVNSSRFVFAIDSAMGDAARRAAEKIMALTPRLPEAHLAMGSYLTLVRHDYPKAIAAYEAGLTLAPTHSELLGNLGLAEQARGNYDKALEYMRRGLTVDPRSLLYTRRLTRALNWLHRFPEAEATARRALEIAPGDHSAIQYAALVRLSQGDLPGAQAFFHQIPPGVDSLDLIVYWIENAAICGWAIPENQRRLALRFPVSMFRGDSITLGFALSCVAQGLGEKALARALADMALQQSRRLDGNGFLLAMSGRGKEAVPIAEKAFQGFERDMYQGPGNRHYLIQTLILAGAYEKALDHLEILLDVPYYITPAWLRIDPTFDPVRQHPRFQKLLAVR